MDRFALLMLEVISEMSKKKSRGKSELERGAEAVETPAAVVFLHTNLLFSCFMNEAQ